MASSNRNALFNEEATFSMTLQNDSETAKRTIGRQDQCKSWDSVKTEFLASLQLIENIVSQDNQSLKFELYGTLNGKAVRCKADSVPTFVDYLRLQGLFVHDDEMPANIVAMTKEKRSKGCVIC